MKKWIRWPGIVAFLCVAIGFVLIWLLFVDMLLKKGVETVGTYIVGAKVELADADATLFPIGLRFSGLRVTNPQSPMRNLVAVDDIRLQLSTKRLLAAKVLAEQAIVEGVHLNTPRKTSGAIKKVDESADVEKKTKTSFFELPKIELQNPTEILQKLQEEDLETLTAAQQLNENMETDKQDMEERLKELPDRKTFEDYRARLEKLKSGGGSIQGLFGSATEANALRKDIRADLDRLRTAESEVRRSVEDYRKRIDDLRKMPEKDIARLKQEYALSPEGLGNFTGLILGPEYADWVKRGTEWYRKIRPLLTERMEGKKETAKAPELKRSRGINVPFKEREPAPDFMVRRAAVSVLLVAGTLAGEIDNITSDQAMIGKPLTFRFTGDHLNGIEAVKIDGAVDYIHPAAPSTRVSGQIKAYRIEQLEITGKETALPLNLSGGLLDFLINLKVKQEILNAVITTSVKDTRISAGKSAQNGLESPSLATTIADALSGIADIDIVTEINGPMEEPVLSFRSNLDQQLKQALGHLFAQRTAAIEKQLSTQIMERTKASISAINNEFIALGNIQEQLVQRLNIGTELFKGL